MFPDIYARLAERLGSAKQKDVAAALGMTQGYVNNLLAVAKGKHLPKGPTTLPYKQLIDWAASNGVSIDWLLTGKEAETPLPEGKPPPGQDWLAMPAHDPRGLDADERRQLECTLTVLRCPPGCASEPREALLPNIKSFYVQAMQHIEAIEEAKRRQGRRGDGREPRAAGKNN